MFLTHLGNNFRFLGIMLAKNEDMKILKENKTLIHFLCGIRFLYCLYNHILLTLLKKKNDKIIEISKTQTYINIINAIF